MLSLDKKWNLEDPNTELYQSVIRSFAVEGIRGLTHQEYGEVQRLMSGMAVTKTSVFSEDPQVRTCASTTVMKTLVIPVIDNLYITEYETQDTNGRLVKVNSRHGFYNIIPAEAILSKETTLFGENIQVTGRSCEISNEVDTEVEETGDFLTDIFRFSFNGSIKITETCRTSEGTVSKVWTFTDEVHEELPISCDIKSDKIKCGALSLTTNKAVIIDVGQPRMKKIVKLSTGADKAKLSEDDFRGNFSIAASGFNFPSTTLGLNTIYWILIGAVLGGAIITAITVGLCKYRGNRTKPSTSRLPSGGTVVHNNIQINPTEPRFKLGSFKRKKDNIVRMEEVPFQPEPEPEERTMTQGELWALEAKESAQ